jgi:hypothetical protein
MSIPELLAPISFYQLTLKYCLVQKARKNGYDPHLCLSFQGWVMILPPVNSVRRKSFTLLLRPTPHVSDSVSSLLKACWACHSDSNAGDITTSHTETRSVPYPILLISKLASTVNSVEVAKLPLIHHFLWLTTLVTSGAYSFAGLRELRKLVS